MSDPKFENAAYNIFGFIDAAFGVDVGKFAGPEDEADHDLAYEGLGRVAVYAAEHPDWQPDWHWSTWKDLVASLREDT